MVTLHAIFKLFDYIYKDKPIFLCSFSLYGQNMEIPKIDLYDVNTMIE